MRIEVGLNYLAEGAEAKLRKLEVLDSERNTDEGAAEYDSKKEEEDSADETTEDEPKNVAESFHEKIAPCLIIVRQRCNHLYRSNRFYQIIFNLSIGIT